MKLMTDAIHTGFLRAHNTAGAWIFIFKVRRKGQHQQSGHAEQGQEYGFFSTQK